MDKISIGFLFGVAFGYILRWAVRRFITGPYQMRRPSAIFTGVTFDNLTTIKGVIEMVELKEGQKAKIHVSPRSRHGHSGAIEPGSARFTSSDESVVSVEQNPDNELEATIRGLDGSSNEPVVISFKADGDRSEGVKEIVGSASVVCTQGDAITFDLEVGPAEDDAEASEPQPEPAPATEPGNGSDTVPPAPVDTAASDTPAGGDVNGAEVKAGDPGTATGDPIPTDNPNEKTTIDTPEGVEAGQPGNDPNDPVDRIEGGGPGSVDDPAEGKTPADGDAKADDTSSPSNDVTGP